MKEPYVPTAPSRSALKRQAHQVEEVVQGLLDLGASQLDRLQWDKPLRSELDLARKTRQHGARKRQVKHLAALLRRDSEALESARTVLEESVGAHRVQVQDFHLLEGLRDRLCQEQSRAEALQEASQRYPACDEALLERLARSYGETGDRRPYREIFRHLRTAAEKTPR
jgi:ribosome-associated protein